jgi:predicted MPP superfamily phosphohydrolase
LVEKEGYDVTLSGHTHGGQILLGNWPVAVYPWTQYVAGTYESDGKTLVVSKGLGTSYYLPVRYHCQAELVLLTIKRKA